jgi:membrane protein implicated in regulation of membrane protease activity
MSASIRPGWKTSEFWLSTAAFVIGSLMASGSFEGTAVDRVFGAIMAVLATLGYSASRAKTKRPRKAEGGVVELLPALAMSLVAVIIGGAMWACAPVAEQTRATAGHVVDCTADEFRAHAADLATRIAASIDKHTAPDGTLDEAAIGEDLAAMVTERGKDAVRCAFDRTVADVLGRPRVAPTDREPMRAGLVRVRAGWLGTTP